MLNTAVGHCTHPNVLVSQLLSACYLRLLPFRLRCRKMERRLTLALRSGDPFDPRGYILPYSSSPDSDGGNPRASVLQENLFSCDTALEKQIILKAGSERHGGVFEYLARVSTNQSILALASASAAPNTDSATGNSSLNRVAWRRIRNNNRAYSQKASP
jgi:hypothetical protein